MKALYFNNHGDYKNLIYGEIQDPKIEKNFALIKVHYCSLNHLDLWILKGWKGLELPMPHIGGADIVGTILDINSETNCNFKIGDQICVNPGYLKTNTQDIYIKKGDEHLSKSYGIMGETCKGGFSELVSVPLSSLHKLANLSNEKLQQISSSLLVGLTSYRMLQSRAKLISGEHVVVVGGGGGLNSFTIKLAKYYGAKVIAITSTKEKESFCLNLGADYIINYKEDKYWSKKVKEITNNVGAEVIIDNVGASTINESIRATSQEGRIITVGNTTGHELNIDNRLIFTKQISIMGSTMGSFKDFSNILEIMMNNNLYAPIYKTYSLAEGANGYKDINEGNQLGKILLSPLF